MIAMAPSEVSFASLQDRVRASFQGVRNPSSPGGPPAGAEAQGVRLLPRACVATGEDGNPIQEPPEGMGISPSQAHLALSNTENGETPTSSARAAASAVPFAVPTSPVDSARGTAAEGEHAEPAPGPATTSGKWPNWKMTLPTTKSLTSAATGLGSLWEASGLRSSGTVTSASSAEHTGDSEHSEAVLPAEAPQGDPATGDAVPSGSSAGPSDYQEISREGASGQLTTNASAGTEDTTPTSPASGAASADFSPALRAAPGLEGLPVGDSGAEAAPEVLVAGSEEGAPSDGSLSPSPGDLSL